VELTEVTIAYQAVHPKAPQYALGRSTKATANFVAALSRCAMAAADVK
jgi:hypothetical protein